jgi:[acyl-carrier-protein] S-malonyltransferase
VSDNAGIAFVFPGQGSQKVGMGKDLYESCQPAKEIFDQADKTLGFPLTNYALRAQKKNCGRL